MEMGSGGEGRNTGLKAGRAMLWQEEMVGICNNNVLVVDCHHYMWKSSPDVFA